MHKYLPSKKFTLTILSIIIALGIIYFFYSLKNRVVTAPSITPADSETKSKVQEFMTLDTDSDGLKDWEEALWKTDPKLADTDKDGTSDGEEVRLNREPLKANTAKAGNTPTDLVDPEIIAENKRMDEAFAKLTQTDQMARTFFSQYIASKSMSGAALAQTNKQIILDTAISMMDTLNTPKYTSADLIISADSGTSTLKAYGDLLARAFFTGTAQETVQNEMEIVNEAVQTENEKKLDDLDPIIESYSKTIAKMLLISVPTEIAPVHLRFLNDLYFVKSGLEGMKKIFFDPLLAMNAINNYQDSVLQLKTDVAELKAYFSKKNITYTQGDYGYVFFNII